MARQRAAPIWARLGIAVVLCSVVQAQSIPILYCADVNTADMQPFNSIYQSEGRCSGNCTDINFALAIVQGHDCWCSNFVPNKSDQKPTNECSNKCPGYPDDWCGGDGLYGYLRLNNPISGTAPGPSPTPSSSTTPAAVKITETKTVQSTVRSTVTLLAPTSKTLDFPSATASTASTTSAIKSETTPTPAAAEPSVQTVTVGGVVKTVTATPIPTGTTSPSLSSLPPSNTGLATGAAVGIAIGVIGAIAVAGVFLWLWCMKRKRRTAEAEARFGTPSVMGSSSGMMTTTPKTGEMTDTRFVGPGGRPTAGWDSAASESAKRRSHLMPIDPRLDPFAKGIYAREQNKSHESVNSLQDNQDYSRRVHQPGRVLRAMNPDPDMAD
ncbi:hypothetical protein B0H63DRAFT_110379 [Podospora didyma]|uniref:WSC domain-containing protein n=1 Tax=Podospora didyma TaxID=330526 RepID=A0AAE0NZ38_9PEZI|nr:hypothetical protein B0H63DRAFT_110379 [Podospora didyma]